MYFTNNDINLPVGGIYSGTNQPQNWQQHMQQPMQQGFYQNNMNMPSGTNNMQSLPFNTNMQQPQQQFMGNNLNGNFYPLNTMNIQPYMDREFLCKTFNFKVPYIEAFLSLSH